MKSYFSPVFFSNNRKKLKSLNANNFPIIVTANGLLQRGADSTYAFSQDANFWYLTGLDEPDLVLVMEPNKDYLIVPKRSSIRETFDGSISTDSLISRSGINDILDDKVGWDKLRHTVSKHQQLATVAPPPEYVEQYGFYTNPSRAVMLQHLKLDNNDLNIIDIGQNLARMRMLKQPEEIKAIQAAVDITIESLQAATKPEMIESYKFEYEMEAEIRGGFRRRGASGDSFEPIVAAGKNACTLHNVANNGKLTRGELLLADVGAEVEHYAADITRVYRNGQVTKRQLEVYAAVADVHTYAMSLLKPGCLMKENEEKIEKFMGDKLCQLNLIKDINHENVRKYYPHSTSHFMGLNVHDVGDYSQPLQEGIVITVEPGIYIANESIGIRLEDDVLITKNGHKVLSDKLIKKL